MRKTLAVLCVIAIAIAGMYVVWAKMGEKEPLVGQGGGNVGMPPQGTIDDDSEDCCDCLAPKDRDACYRIDRIDCDDDDCDCLATKMVQPDGSGFCYTCDGETCV